MDGLQKLFPAVKLPSVAEYCHDRLIHCDSVPRGPLHQTRRGGDYDPGRLARRSAFFHLRAGGLAGRSAEKKSVLASPR